MSLYPLQSSMTRGEISPRLHARSSLDLYQSSLAKCENFITLPHGGIRKRGGTMFVGATKSATLDTRLIEFKYSEDQAYCLEFGALYVRVYAYGQYITEFESPWHTADLDGLQYVQSASTMWVVHQNYKPHKIQRIANATWTVTPVVFSDGPFGGVNFDETQTVYASAATGTITLTASAPIFSADDVGRLFRLEMESYRTITPWEPNGVIAESGGINPTQFCRYDGNVYKIITPLTESWRFGATPPTHTKGIEQDGPIANDASYGDMVGIELQYIHSGFGVARITSYTNANSVQATVVSRFPTELVGVANAAYQWSFGAFNIGDFPVAVTLFEERLCFASQLSVYCSKTGDFNSFKTGEKDDDALEFLLAGNEANDIVWLADADGSLAIGTIGGVRVLSGSGIDEALTPSSFKNRASATQRCASMQPINTGQAFLYIASGARSISEMVLGEGNRFQSTDASQISEHIAKQGSGITSIAYQEYPDSMSWSSLANGEAMGFTYQRDQEVRGFHRHRLGGRTAARVYGLITSIAVTPGRNGTDDIWMIVKRRINDQLVQYIEMMQPAFEYGDVEDVFAVDCGLTYEGTPRTNVSGLEHLEGQTVSVLADGRRYDGRTVVDGRLSQALPQVAGKITIGLPFVSTADTLELDAGGRDGSLIGRRKRVQSVILSLLETDIAGLEVSSIIKGRWEKAKLPSIAIDDGTMKLYTGNISIPVDDSFEGQARVSIRHSGPGPCTIRALVPAFDSEP